MEDSWHADSRTPRTRRLITASISSNVTKLLTGANCKCDDFTLGSVLILSETVETSWLKQSPNLKSYADQSKMFKSSVYKIKVGQFLREQCILANSNNSKYGTMSDDIDEIKKHLKELSKK